MQLSCLFGRGGSIGAVPALSAAALIAISGLARAQPENLNATPRSAPPAFPVTPAPGNPFEPKQTISLDFPGGSLTDFIAALRAAAAPTPVNVMLPELSSEIRVSAVSLKDVTVRNAIRAIRYCASTESIEVDAGPVSEDAGSAPIYAVRAERRTRPPGPFPENLQARPGTPSEPILDVVSIDDIVKAPAQLAGRADTTISTENVLAAIELATKAAGEPPPEVMFHKDSNLILVKGTQWQIELVREIVDRLQSSTRQRREEAGKVLEQSSVLRTQMIRAEVQSRQAESQIQLREQVMRQAQEKLERARQMMEKGGASADELAGAQMSVVKSEADLVEARAALEASRAEIDALHDAARNMEAVQAESPPESAAAAIVTLTVPNDPILLDAIRMFVDAAKGDENLPRMSVVGAPDGGNAAIALEATPRDQRMVKAAVDAMRMLLDKSKGRVR